MQGEIDVQAVMGRSERIGELRARHRRDAEWYALKQWWRAERAVSQAKSREDRQRALKHRATTARLYRAELDRAWPKWQRVLADRAARRRDRIDR